MKRTYASVSTGHDVMFNIHKLFDMGAKSVALKSKWRRPAEEKVEVFVALLRYGTAVKYLRRPH